jgi:hypothetical protein
MVFFGSFIAYVLIVFKLMDFWLVAHSRAERIRYSLVSPIRGF